MTDFTQTLITKLAAGKLRDDAGKLITQIEDNGLRARFRSGHVSYIFRYRLNGVRKEKALGRVSLAQAQAMANDLRGDVQVRGIDVAARAAEDKRREGKTLGAVLDAFLAAKGADYARVINIKSALNCHIRPKFGSVSIYDLNRDQVAAHLVKLSQEKPQSARDARKFLGWAVEWFKAAEDSTVTFELPKAKAMAKGNGRRKRFLTDAEVRDVWLATAEVAPAYRALVRLLLLTGSRRGEIAGLEAGWIAADRIVFPPEIMKARIEHHVPLLPAIAELTAAVMAPTQAWGNFAPCKKAIDAAIVARCQAEGREAWPVTRPWVLHDLRRAMRTRLNRITDHHTAEAMIAHSLTGVHAVYDGDDRWDARREAYARWHGVLAHIVDGKAGSNVTPLPFVAAA